ncbi:hypothetical protein D9619_005039 [Psilocybe cf. subviscida]|uniref:Serine/threonine-protein phosphatase 2A activator n=1 Tax=Psilocybe cf. subviscida TaxID=2480587 RepID=A0A8H5F8H1_9AGAR|nr:hypothetical protein D9619_005039 [Psilocybe cf. subviscida]
MAADFSTLRSVPLANLIQMQPPTLKIVTDSDVEHWKATQSYIDYSLFLRRLNDSVVNCNLPWNSASRSSAVERTVMLLDTLDSWIDDIPPLQTPQRFGNLAFRGWGKRLEERADAVLNDLVGHEFSTTIPFVKPYLLAAFGSFTRMDYGTGHETSFALFLLCLTLVRFYQPDVEEEKELVLTVFLRYLRLCWRLQDVYKLEPAGSHGVWGLDDYCFLPYIFGSGELRDQTQIPVSAILSPNLPLTNLYFMAINRIHDVKYGPFHEHSSQLHSIASGVPNWRKVNTGLFKMYEAEVLGKRVVVQHIPLGGLLEWETAQTSPPTSLPSTATARTQVPGIVATPATPAPWAPITRYTRP